MELWEFADLATPWCVHVVVTLRVAEHMAAGHSAIAELAACAGANRDALGRVLRHLVERGFFEEPEPGRFTLNDAARTLLDPSARLGFDLEGIGGRMAHAWSTLLGAVSTGKPAYHEVFRRPFWEDLDANPAVAATFDALMSPAGHGPADPRVLLHPEDWESVRTVVDVGGGTGALLAAVLRAHPHLAGILVDLPRTVARSAEVFQDAGVADRATAVGQSFFDPLPAGADLYLLKSVLCDWPDEEAVAILRRLAQAAQPAGRVVIVSGVNPAERASPELLMLVLVGGKDRTLEEFRHLAEGAGLAIQEAGRTPSGRFVVECVPIAAG